MRKHISNIAGVGIIYRASDPSQVFIEMKDDGHPIKLVRRQLCPIGGNWIGEDARADRNPFDTFIRELKEELTLKRPVRDSLDLRALGLADNTTFAPTRIDTVPTEDDSLSLDQLVEHMIDFAEPFGDYLTTVSREALDRADPENRRDGFTALASYHRIPLDEVAWSTLCTLQATYGNLSSESMTVITSFEEIGNTGTRIAFGHDQALNDFFEVYAGKRGLPTVQGVTGVPVGDSLSSYDEYMARYEIAKHP